MSLTEREILALLKTMDPDEILAAKKDQLDEAGQSLLGKLRDDIRAGEAMFRDAGFRFRQADPAGELEGSRFRQPDAGGEPAVMRATPEEFWEFMPCEGIPEADGESPSTPTSQKERRAAWLFRSNKVPRWAVAAAAILLVVSFLPTLLNWNELRRTRSRSSDLAGVQAVNNQLVEILINRGELLVEVDSPDNPCAYCQEARDDLMQAYELDPGNERLLSLLARVHEKLGLNRQAARFLAEWKAIQERQDPP